jgi:hypothetical protein
LRRDVEADRGPLLCVLGVGAVLFAPALVGVVIGAVVWRLADADIRGMRAATMHPDGRWGAEHARQFGMAAVVFGGLMYAAVGGILLWQRLFGP